MASTPKKPLGSSTMSSGGPARRPPAPSSSPTPRGPSPGTVLSTNGIARNSSTKATPGAPRPGVRNVRRPGSIVSAGSSLGATGNEDNVKDEDARAENAALIDSLKHSVRSAELVSEDYQHQLAAAQQKMDDLMQDHAKLEERFHESAEKIEELEAQRRESVRHVREMESIYESEKAAMLKDREEAISRESELKSTIQRLKETMAGREVRLGNEGGRRSPRPGRSPTRPSSSDEVSQFAPSSSAQRSDSKSTSQLVMQKDQLIEQLRLEIAEFQMKLIEMENMGGGHLQELEKQLLETRMANARLMEDNESFQLLLGEKTLNGDLRGADFMQESYGETSKLDTLAEELESAEGESDNYRRVEAEAKSLRDQNKALTLYVEKIISRVLMHENFETILDQKPGAPATGLQKELPPPPPNVKDESIQPSLLDRAMSVARRQRPASTMFSSSPQVQDELSGGHKPRPQSQVIVSAPEYVPTANEDPLTAPSIPLGRAQSSRGRGHRRTQSDTKSTDVPGAAAVVNQMYRGPSNSPGGPMSTPMSPGGTTPRTQYFGPSALTGSSNSSARPPSGPRAVSGLRASSGQDHSRSNSGSIKTQESGEMSSPPRNSAGNTQYTGAVMTQNKLRPLRLVQGNLTEEEIAAAKKANRGSWMGWFKGGKEEGPPRSVSGPAESAE